MRRYLILYSILLCIILLLGTIMIERFNQQGHSPSIYSSTNFSQKSLLGELPSKIGNLSEIKPNPYKLLSNRLEEEREDHPPTNKWFSPGPIHFGISSGLHLPHDLVEIHLENVPLNKPIRIKFTQRNQDLQILQTFEDKVVKSSTTKVDFTYSLLETENSFYILSAEVLSDGHEVEDALMTGIYVPHQEMNARIAVEQQKKDIMEMVLENAGPTTLFLGRFYSVERLRDNTWYVVPFNGSLAFTADGITVEPGDRFKQEIPLAGLEPGTYRVIKEVQAEGTKIKRNLASVFKIE